tara:strand:+ start:64 stop:519 length:456 start_codon:yes stop_codon:yes gene_type:complete
MSGTKRRGYNELCCGLILVALASIAGCTQEPPPPPEEVIDPLQPPPRTIVTQEIYDQLLYDTPYQDVVDFLGMDPSRQESTYSEGVEGYTSPTLISWYIWDNPDGSFIKLGFTQKILTDMSSEDLPHAQDVSPADNAAQPTTSEDPPRRET